MTSGGLAPPWGARTGAVHGDVVAGADSGPLARPAWTNEAQRARPGRPPAPVTRLHVHAWGDEGAPAVVCLHGVTGWGGHFAGLASKLAGGHRLLAPDLLGHGSSTREPPWRLDDHLDAVERTVGDAPIWLGHSFGARLAFEHAARHPGSVERLVLLDPAILLPPHVALWAAENARAERAYASFEDGGRPPLPGEPAPCGAARAGGERAPRSPGRGGRRRGGTGTRRRASSPPTRSSRPRRRRSTPSACRRCSCSARSRTSPTTTCSTAIAPRSATCFGS